MAWNEVPAKDDAKFRLQAYYARLNILRQFLSPFSVQVFEESWKAARDQDLGKTARSALVGEISGLLIKSLRPEEVSLMDPPVGGWFVHSGITRYRRDGDDQVASLVTAGGTTLQGIIRRECVITNSALANMRGEDDVSFILGRRTAQTKFDLVVAGFREAWMHLHGTDRIVEIAARSPIEQDPKHSLLPYLVPRIQISGITDEQTLAYAVNDTIDRFTRAVEKEGAWRILYDANGKPAHETRHQALFRLFAQLSFVAIGATIQPNADHGRGPTDITLTLNGAVHVIEFKKDTSISKIEHGLKVQLPLYMESAGAMFGSYIVMCHEREKSKVLPIIADAEDSRVVISTYVVDCRKQKSASIA